jgi:putative DNA primase/helicase
LIDDIFPPPLRSLSTTSGKYRDRGQPSDLGRSTTSERMVKAQGPTINSASRHAQASVHDTAWRTRLIEGRHGPLRGVANVLTVLTSHPAWQGVLVYDAFRDDVIKRGLPPVRAQDGVSALGDWTDADTTRTCAWFASEIGFEPTAKHVEQAVSAAAASCAVHPVRDYLHSLKWDGMARLDDVLASYFGAQSTEYARQVGSRWMISAVARVMQPGCQADCVLVLEGPQGRGKSTGLAALTGVEWFADTGLAIGDKDSYQCLRGKWCYELGELDALKGREETRVKMYVSARVDTYRPSYGARARDFRRQIVFAGTTNEDTYLTDSSGNRRWWPVRVGQVDVEAIRRNRDQLWAEAVARYDTGAAWHVDTPELRALCEAEQREREIEDPWLPLVVEWLAEPQQKLRRERQGVTTTEVLAGAIRMEPDRMRRSEQTRVGYILRRLEWKAAQRREGGGRVRRYFPDVAGACNKEGL